MSRLRRETGREAMRNWCVSTALRCTTSLHNDIPVECFRKKPLQPTHLYSSVPSATFSWISSAYVLLPTVSSLWRTSKGERLRGRGIDKAAPLCLGRARERAFRAEAGEKRAPQLDQHPRLIAGGGAPPSSRLCGWVRICYA